mmetsp:Transcript_96771/g.242742  ORF Transcript_96771/g.242742 Transcript_96771/m.242742 type:complete len:299 (-) Transcript_96771:1622-2518(-)
MAGAAVVSALAPAFAVLAAAPLREALGARRVATASRGATVVLAFALALARLRAISGEVVEAAAIEALLPAAITISTAAAAAAVAALRLGALPRHVPEAPAIVALQVITLVAFASSFATPTAATASLSAPASIVAFAAPSATTAAPAALACLGILWWRRLWGRLHVGIARASEGGRHPALRRPVAYSPRTENGALRRAGRRRWPLRQLRRGVAELRHRLRQLLQRRWRNGRDGRRGHRGAGGQEGRELRRHRGHGRRWRRSWPPRLQQRRRREVTGRWRRCGLGGGRRRQPLGGNCTEG